MNFSERIFSILIGTAITVVSPQIAVALPPEQIVEIAKQITVQVNRIDSDDEGGFGSGVIFKRQGNIYSVITNYHVVQNRGKYEIKTSDGKHYLVESRNKIPELDIAILQFKSDQNYSVANLGDSSKIIQTNLVYVAGFDYHRSIPNGRAFHFCRGEITSKIDEPVENGYNLVYTNYIVEGVSGGSVLDENGTLIGINGELIRDDLLLISGRGISINAVVAMINNSVSFKPLVDSSPPQTTDEKLFIRQIQVVGSTVFEAKQFNPIIQRLVNKAITEDELRMALREITQLYLDEGYLNSRAILKTITDGNIKIQVIEGTIRGEQRANEILSVEQALDLTQKQIAIKPALIYVNFVPPEISKDFSFNQNEQQLTKPSLAATPEDDYELELVMVTAEGKPFRVPVNVTRKQIIATATEFHAQVKNENRDYKGSAEKLYRWIIAPI